MSNTIPLFKKIYQLSETKRRNAVQAMQEAQEEGQQAGQQHLKDVSGNHETTSCLLSP